MSWSAGGCQELRASKAGAVSVLSSVGFGWVCTVLHVRLRDSAVSTQNPVVPGAQESGNLERQHQAAERSIIYYLYNNTYQYYFSPISKTQHIPVPMKKINFIPAETSTVGHPRCGTGGSPPLCDLFSSHLPVRYQYFPSPLFQLDLFALQQSWVYLDFKQAKCALI